MASEQKARSRVGVQAMGGIQDVNARTRKRRLWSNWGTPYIGGSEKFGENVSGGRRGMSTFRAHTNRPGRTFFPQPEKDLDQKASKARKKERVGRKSKTHGIEIMQGESSPHRTQPRGKKLKKTRFRYKQTIIHYKKKGRKGRGVSSTNAASTPPKLT